MNRGAKIDRLSSPPNAPVKFSPKKEIRTGWVPRVAACSPCCRCGSSRLFLDCSRKDAPISLSVWVDLALAMPLGLRGFHHRPNCRPKPCAIGLELFNSTSRECPKTFRLLPPPCVGFSTWVAPSGWAARVSVRIRGVSSPLGFQRPFRESLVGWASCHAPRDAPFDCHPAGWASCSAPKSLPCGDHPAGAPLRVGGKKLLSVARPKVLPKPFSVSPANLSKSLCRQMGLVR